MAIIAFDVDGTLRGLTNDEPRTTVISLLVFLKQLGNRIIVWSGGGADYAAAAVRKLGLSAVVDEIDFKCKETSDRLKPDVCFDDEFVELAKVNIKV